MRQSCGTDGTCGTLGTALSNEIVKGNLRFSTFLGSFEALQEAGRVVIDKNSLTSGIDCPKYLLLEKWENPLILLILEGTHNHD